MSLDNRGGQHKHRIGRTGSLVAATNITVTVCVHVVARPRITLTLTLTLTLPALISWLSDSGKRSSSVCVLVLYGL